ncbi:glycine N-methyltransferase-like [Homarus americanus]|uniref:Glycine N-methyltransferase n=1 Tax=Homarus americanus TaxID=6706 RepID=A0A8J5TL47_HOMAM|nr:glycine N-methyltransferase-like [Homarus americanus]XP_042219336.1 glycine N-methyltransferase-like [Homarus americanus]XP_042219337.1 glycine N-methyltransferase-like [Homarus americanus]XP_042219338.1 glycine N-methyltransferase-like [Homarus americanus]KAG7177391.1 Glycine N-methyltransferase-like [Homarus americanus]
MTDNRVYRTRTLGIPAEGLKDQYADGIAAKLWELYIGDKNKRTDIYRKFITKLLREKKCHNILDVACGTGVDSIMLLEEGFQMTSVDLSDKMLKFALKTRWRRRKEPAFDNWEIEEANWLTLPEDIEGAGTYDAVICLGNSFAHLPDVSGDQSEHKLALKNFAHMVKPGGVLLIDHRNYDNIIDSGSAPSHNIYYNSEHIQDIKTSVLYVNGKPSLVTLDYLMDVKIASRDDTDSGVSRKGRVEGPTKSNFRLSYFPHRVAKFGELLQEAFGERSEHCVYGDFKPIGEVKDPGFYIHVVVKPT